MKKLVLSLLLVASGAASAASWGPAEIITSIEAGDTAVYFASPSYTVCGSATGQTKLDWNTAHAKEIYAAVLSAYLAGKPVKLLTSGCTGIYYNVNGANF